MAIKSKGAANNKFIATIVAALAITVIVVILLFSKAPYRHERGESIAFTKTQVEEIVRDYIMENPKIILEATEKFYVEKANQANAEAKKNIAIKTKELEEDPEDPRAGQGKIKVIEAFDYKCTYCRQMAATKIKLLENNKNIQFIFKETPMFGKDSLMAAKAALAVNKLDKTKYFTFQIELLNSHELSESTLEHTVRKIGLNWDAVKQEMGSQSIANHITRNLKLIQDIGISGTPAYIVAGEIIPGRVSFEELQKIIDTKK